MVPWFWHLICQLNYLKDLIQSISSPWTTFLTQVSHCLGLTQIFLYSSSHPLNICAATSQNILSHIIETRGGQSDLPFHWLYLTHLRYNIYFDISLSPVLLMRTKYFLFVSWRSHSKVTIKPSLLQGIFIAIKILITIIWPVIHPMNPRNNLILRIIQGRGRSSFS